MMPLEILFLLIVAHAIADYPLQTDFVALRKSRHNNLPAVPWYYVLSSHALTHAAGVYLVTGSVLLAALESVAHWFIDLAKCESLTNIHVDQALHVACKAAWVALLMA